MPMALQRETSDKATRRETNGSGWDPLERMHSPFRVRAYWVAGRRATGMGQTLAQFETELVSRLAGNSGTTTCRRRQPTLFVVSGVTDDGIFYAKTLLVGDIQKSFEFTYPRERADVFSAVTARIISSFRSLGTGR